MGFLCKCDTGLCTKGVPNIESSLQLISDHNNAICFPVLQHSATQIGSFPTCVFSHVSQPNNSLCRNCRTERYLLRQQVCDFYGQPVCLWSVSENKSRASSAIDLIVLAGLRPICWPQLQSLPRRKNQKLAHFSVQVCFQSCRKFKTKLIHLCWVEWTFAFCTDWL